MISFDDSDSTMRGLKIPRLLYSSRVFFSPTLKPSVWLVASSSSCSVMVLVCLEGFYVNEDIDLARDQSITHGKKTSSSK